MSKVLVHNEWDPLEEVIVGTSLYAGLPECDFSFEVLEGLTDGNKHDKLHFGFYPQKIIDETEEDLASFIAILEKLGVTVKRPAPIHFSKTFKTLDWEANHSFCYCPRDILLAIGTSIIEAPSPYRSRYFEAFSYKDILVDYSRSGARWFAAPKPRLLDNMYDTTPNADLVLKNNEPAFDAANILRAGRDLLYLISKSGNEAGLHWLQNILGNEYRVHPCRNLYSGLHIDTTISLLRPGLALINPSRVNKNNLPMLLKDWEILKAPEMVAAHYSDFPPLTTEWLGMNLLMLSPTLAVVEQDQTPLIRCLEAKKIDVIPARLRHGRALGGGFHCITLDVRRTGALQDYFS